MIKRKLTPEEKIEAVKSYMRGAQLRNPRKYTVLRCPTCRAEARNYGPGWECPWCGDFERITGDEQPAGGPLVRFWANTLLLRTVWGKYSISSGCN